MTTYRENMAKEMCQASAGKHCKNTNTKFCVEKCSLDHELKLSDLQISKEVELLREILKLASTESDCPMPEDVECHDETCLECIIDQKLKERE